MLANAWLQRDLAKVVSLVTYFRIACHKPAARCLLVAGDATFFGFPEDLQSDVCWLEGADFEETE
jgi:hypothetical protein